MYRLTLKSQNGQGDFTCYGTVGVDDINQTDIGSLSDREIHWSERLVPLPPGIRNENIAYIGRVQW